MPAPTFAGDTDWGQVLGKRSGINNGIVFYELPYEGRQATADNFRSSWTRGTACPVPGFDHLKLVNAPEINEIGAGKAQALLRFEGADLNGNFGEAEERIENLHWQRRSVTFTDTTAEMGTVYLYDVAVITVTYTRDSRRSEPYAAPSGLGDPIFRGIERRGVGLFNEIKEVDELVEGTDYKVTTTSSLKSVIERAPGAYFHTEVHERIAEQIVS